MEHLRQHDLDIGAGNDLDVGADRDLLDVQVAEVDEVLGETAMRV